MLTIGLTGDVGAGKSTLCKSWRQMGAEIIDADTVARSLWFQPAVRKKAEKRWGENFFDADEKTLFAKIADKIFSDDSEYEFAGKLLRAPTMREIKKRLKQLSKNEWAVVEIPLLYEGGYEEMFDITVYAAATLKKRAERNTTRKWTAEELKRRQSKLLPRKEKMLKADIVLRNSGTAEQWREKAEKTGRKFAKLAAAQNLKLEKRKINNVSA